MIGAIIGDVVGSRFEWNNIKTKEFDLFTNRCFATDDSIMTLAIGKAILLSKEDYSDLQEKAIDAMQEFGRAYENRGYGGHFIEWIYADDPQPYNSWGNGSAMRVSACGYAGKTLEEVLSLAEKVTAVTHNHEEGIKGAKATAAAIFLAREGKSIDEIREYINENFYKIDFTLDEIRDSYTFDVSCQGTVPQSLEAFFESTDFEDAIRNAISIGGDSDTLAAITGSIAQAYYGVPQDIRNSALNYLDAYLYQTLLQFEDEYIKE